MENHRREYIKIGYERGLQAMLKILHKNKEIHEILVKKSKWIENELIKELDHI